VVLEPFKTGAPATLQNEHDTGRLVTFVTQTNRLSSVFRSTDTGTGWTAMAFPGDADGGVNPGGQALTNCAILADRTDATVVYVSGDCEPTNSGAADGATNWTGRIFRGDADSGGPQWTAAVANGANNTAPHADSRAMVFDANGVLLEADDGGLYRLLDAATNSRRWVSCNGNLRVNEIWSLAYDPLNNVIFTGNQDTGTAVQPGRLPDPVDLNYDGAADDVATRSVWRQITQGDGNTEAAVVVRGADGLERTVRLVMGNSLTAFLRMEFDNTGADVTPPATTRPDGRRVNQFNNVLVDIDPSQNPNPDPNEVGLRLSDTQPIRSGLYPEDRDGNFLIAPLVVNAVDP